MLLGGDSPEHIKAATESVVDALSDARVAVLDGQQHVAHLMVPELFAEHVLSFLRGRR